MLPRPVGLFKLVLNFVCMIDIHLKELDFGDFVILTRICLRLAWSGDRHDQTQTFDISVNDLDLDSSSQGHEKTHLCNHYVVHRVTRKLKFVQSLRCSLGHKKTQTCTIILLFTGSQENSNLHNHSVVHRVTRKLKLARSFHCGVK